jgi:hypothetical protein
MRLRHRSCIGDLRPDPLSPERVIRLAGASNYKRGLDRRRTARMPRDPRPDVPPVCAGRKRLFPTVELPSRWHDNLRLPNRRFVHERAPAEDFDDVLSGAAYWSPGEPVGAGGVEYRPAHRESLPPWRASRRNSTSSSGALRGRCRGAPRRGRWCARRAGWWRRLGQLRIRSGSDLAVALRARRRP